jgi:molybdate transport system substrate-binding protein
MSARGRVAALALAAAGLFAPGARAAEVRLLSAGAVELGLRPALALFQRESGHVVHVEFATAPALLARFAAPPGHDLVIAPPAVLDALARSGAIAGPRVPVGKVGVGVAVRPDVPVPEIGDVAALKSALLAAESVVFNRASTGLYVETLLGRLGLAEQVAAKASRHPDGASVMKHLLASRVPREIGFGAITEIVLFKDQGLRLVGPLPAEVQNYTSYVASAGAAPPADPARADAAAALLRFLAGAETRTIFAGVGIEPAAP